MNKAFYAASVAVAAFAMAPSAQALEMYGGPISLTTTDSVNYTGTFGVTHAGAFEDTWTFGPLPAGLADASVVSIGIGVKNIDFTSITLNGTPVPFLVDTSVPFLGIGDVGGIEGLFSPGGINVLVLKGTSGSNASYSGTVNFTVTPVPEPTSWTLMIAGIGILGTAMRHRARRARIAFS